ncbi:hypothetical protein SprV_0200837500 [Sparganum proliferum]
MLVTKAIPGADGWTDHHPVIAKCGFTYSLAGDLKAAMARLPQLETNVDLDLPPSLHEAIRAVQQLSSGKAPGSDAIPAEIYKHGGLQHIDSLTALF